MRAIFLDREGTLNTEPSDEIVDSPDSVWLLDTVIDGLKILSELDYRVFIVTNQVGIARKRITVDQFSSIHKKIIELLEPSGIKITKTYVCPHEPANNCDCRKPKKGMIIQALKDFPDIELSDSWVIGDRLSDVGLASAIGSRMVLINQTGKYAVDTAEFVVPNFIEAARTIQFEDSPA